MIDFLSLSDVTRLHGSEIHAAVERVVDSGWYLLGAEVKGFESRYADFIGTRHAIGCANGLDALTLIFRAYREMGAMNEGDEVIVPANTYIATILAITENGLVPVLAEPNKSTLEIDENQVERLISNRTRAVCIVHLYGRNAYTDRIGELCKQHNLKLIEDNAQAHGAFATADRRTGAIGDAAGHSFYPGKNLGALGDGGAVTTDDDALAEVVRTLANYGSSRKYVFDYRGRNSRLDEIQAAVLSVKLKYLDADNDHRRMIADYYYRNLPSDLLPARCDDRQNVYHLFPILYKERDALQAYLKENGIGSLIHYPIPPHKQQCYAAWNGVSFPITEEIARQELSLPIGPAITVDEASRVVETVNRFVS